jgi:hypothetical protein
MADITLEKNHALLEKLAEFVMNKIPQIERTLAQLEAGLAKKVDKSDLLKVDEKINRLLEGIDHQAKEIDDFRIEKKAISYTLDVHEERIGVLEERNLGYRVREDGKEEGKITN